MKMEVHQWGLLCDYRAHIGRHPTRKARDTLDTHEMLPPICVVQFLIGLNNKNTESRRAVVEHAFIPSTPEAEAEAGGSL